MPTPKRLGDRVYLCPLIVKLNDVDHPDAPSIEVTADVIDGDMQIRRVALYSEPGERQIQRSDLRRVSVDEIRERVIEDFGMRVDSSTGTASLTMLVDGTQEPNATSNRESRRRAQKLDLPRVAKVYSNAEHAPTKAVAEAFVVAHRTASLYVKQAREAGLLPRYSREQGEK